MIPQDTASRQDDRRLLSVKFRGADKDTGNRALGACAVLHLITKGLPAQAAWRRPSTQPASLHGEPGSGYATGKKAESGNQVGGAGS